MLLQSVLGCTVNNLACMFLPTPRSSPLPPCLFFPRSPSSSIPRPRPPPHPPPPPQIKELFTKVSFCTSALDGAVAERILSDERAFALEASLAHAAASPGMAQHLFIVRSARRGLSTPPESADCGGGSVTGRAMPAYVRTHVMLSAGRRVGQSHQDISPSGEGISVLRFVVPVNYCVRPIRRDHAGPIQPSARVCTVHSEGREGGRLRCVEGEGEDESLNLPRPPPAHDSNCCLTLHTVLLIVCRASPSPSPSTCRNRCFCAAGAATARLGVAPCGPRSAARALGRFGGRSRRNLCCPAAPAGRGGREREGKGGKTRGPDGARLSLGGHWP